MTPLSVVIHAPEPEALMRARSNARNLLKAAPDARCEIVVNAGAVAAALDQPDPETDALLRICDNTLAHIGRNAPANLTVVEAAVVHLAKRQHDGWQYIRA